MPLPDGGPWPPKEYTDAFDAMRAWSAWYSGNPDELSLVYQLQGQQLVNRPHVRPSQMRGGLVGTVARWFWGQPITPGEKRTKVHVPIAADIAATSADLLFSERIDFSADDKATQAALDDLLTDELHATLLEAGELAAALSGVYLRVVWDKDVNPKGPWLQPVDADAAVPEWRYGRLSAVTFVRQLVCEKTIVVRHLERHEVGAILHGVYEGSETDLGRRVPLNEYPETENLADVVDQGDVIETGIDQLTATYWPNIRPNRRWRSSPSCAPFGRSDFDGSEGLMDALDETFTSWMRDLRLAKARILVPESFLMDRGAGKGALFDPDREAYETLNMIPAADGSSQLTLQQFSIRVQEHEQTMLATVGRIVTTAGYSQQTFGLTGDVAATATEVTARERKSLITRDKKINYVRPRLAEIVQAMLKIGQVHFGWTTAPDTPPTVNFPDAVQQDPAGLAQTLALLETARAASTKTKVQMLHPDWDDDQVTEEVKAIMAENTPPPVQNPDTFTGDPAGDPSADKPPADKPPASE